MSPVAHVISVSSGKDSTALLSLAIERCPTGSVYPIFCDTGNENKAVYDYLDYLERRFQIKIARLKADFSEQIAAKRAFIANDLRTGRELLRIPCIDARGNPVPAREPGSGRIITETVKLSDGGTEVRPVQKVRKVRGAKVRWTNKAKRRALAVLHPTGNAFLDLCLWKGRFPSRKAQFCTQELKRDMAVGYQIDLIEQGFRVVSWQGVRRDESENRKNAKRMERVGPNLWAFRPIVEWSAVQVFARHASHDIEPNPLYRQGMSRVGCMPCINCNKAELREISKRFPREIDRIERWEWLVGQASKRGFSTLLMDAHDAKDRRQIFADLNIRARVEWSMTSRGGRQIDLFADAPPTACASAYGLCD